MYCSKVFIVSRRLWIDEEHLEVDLGAVALAVSKVAHLWIIAIKGPGFHI